MVTAIFAIALVVVLAGSIAAVIKPLGRARDEDLAGQDRRTKLEDLEARREAKYREIRDAELDHAAGKVSDPDFARQDAQLRAEAIEILDALDDLRDPAEPPAKPPAP